MTDRSNKFKRGWKWWLKCVFACYGAGLALFIIQDVASMPLSQSWEAVSDLYKHSVWLIPVNMAICFPFIYRYLR